VGESALVGDYSTVPLTRISCNPLYIFLFLKSVLNILKIIGFSTNRDVFLLATLQYILFFTLRLNTDGSQQDLHKITLGLEPPPVDRPTGQPGHAAPGPWAGQG
jgi:hypothetical protein